MALCEPRHGVFEWPATATFRRSQDCVASLLRLPWRAHIAALHRRSAAELEIAQLGPILASCNRHHTYPTNDSVQGLCYDANIDL